MRYRSISSIVLVVMLLLGGIMLFASGCGDEYVYNPGTGEGAPGGVETGPVSIGAVAFVSDYQVSATAADAKYANREIEVRGGTVTAVFSNYFIMNAIVKVIPESAGVCVGLEIGDKVDVRGKVDEYSREEGLVPILNATVVSQ